ncbi:hypothetical protein BDP27DRAFT_1322304 [Rhodocollybia butyracea]|uniref:Uncharacterized protein n=1 Tax=Rhodocollybia butyracea TaxID=206335 RepID=A0A9P5PXY5_9AGAR|nr:hypothetical protein BDP27DRAFT_1338004 [Rhodocollybia butyracea]KAF9071304.1 hypothetical protein BDP27DRAFT_1322304 [Rhodocollybia butyracea]
MTSAEQEQFFFSGFYCYANIIGAVIFAIADGIATLGILIVIRLLQVKTWREPKAIQLLCCVLIWLCLIGQTILLALTIFGQIRQVEGIPTPINFIIINNIKDALCTVMILAGDLVLCWRAWVLLPHDKSWRFVLAIMMICNIGLNIADLISDEIAVVKSTSTPVLDSVAIATSLAVNMTATSLIGWKAWWKHFPASGCILCSNQVLTLGPITEQ